MKLLISVILLCLMSSTVFADGKSEMNQGSYDLRAGKFKSAVFRFSNALQSEEIFGEARAAVLISRGQAYYHLHNYKPAIADLTAAIRSGDINDTLVGIALASRASAYRMSGLYKLSVKDFNSAMDIGTINAKMFFHRGLALEANGQHKQAKADFERAFKMAPDNMEFKEKLDQLIIPADTDTSLH